MEKAFTLIQVSDDSKRDYASYFLKGEVNFWWEFTRALEGEGRVSWTIFTELFLEKYFLDCLQSQLEVEFSELKQGENSVAEYEAKFTEMARLAPGYVNSKIQKAMRFQQGLKPEVHSGMAALQLKTNKRFRRQGFSQTSSGVTSVVSALVQSTKPIVEWNPGVTCFKCGKVGHISRNCKVVTQGIIGGSASQGPTTSTARDKTFKMTKRSNAQDSDMVADELPGLPPDHEIEFSINLIPGAELVSKASYRMAPMEMNELGKKLQELLDKGLEEVQFLGHIVGKDGIKVDPVKIEAVSRWEQPKTPTS
ncbi:uncharacterized protein LOC141674576 [Apium graveolens]|uniref:uncharacterized protein LOC141674576 n=1 Tax=Apium graveolens TaxID=4045 RepID=UPI003D7901A9